ncbi:MAG: glycosyltransferase [Rhodanobacter sp.]|nr:MAG: glycosyltransferase [Rhodanobacter sp.]
MKSPRIHGLDCADEKTTVVDLALVAIVTVTYNPDPEILDRQLGQLPSAALKVVVDNASRPELRAKVMRVVAERRALLLQNDTNRGLPAAINQGAGYAQHARPSCRFLLLLDQDSEPGVTGGVTGVEQLIARYEPIAALAGRPCCIGPRLIDVATGLDHGFHQIRGWRWSRTFPSPDCRTPVPVANLNGSGTLMPLILFNQLGGLEEDFFIDHVDTEWAFRVLDAGFGLYGVPDVSFIHRMGESSLRFWWMGWRIWPRRSPLRHRYLYRNAVWLMRRSYVPTVWKAWALAKLLLTLLVHMAFDCQRISQIAAMFHGVKNGLCTAPEKPEGNSL